ncbi:MAG: lysophospholipid acyltransferase family protein [Actinobacteria bacterium]|nr:lysophospholipid acyltransferase family protein [Actinomycetota bacterium]
MPAAPVPRETSSSHAIRAPFGRGRKAARVLGHIIDGAAAIGGRLPQRVAHSLALLGGNIEWAVRPSVRRRLGTNLARACGAQPGDRVVRRIVRREMVNEARRSADLLWAISRPAAFLQTVRIDGIDVVAEAAARGRGVLLAGIHLGGWEVAAAVPRAAIPVPTTVVVADNWLAWAIEHIRTEVGLHILYRSGTALAAIKVLQRGEALLILGDDAFGSTPRTYDVDFCGSRARLPAGIVALSRLTGSPIVPFDVLPLGARRWCVRFTKAIEPPNRDDGEVGERHALQLLADHWTDAIRRYPEHWAARFAISWGAER